MKTAFLKLKTACKNLKDWVAVFFSRVFWKDKIVLWGLASALFLNSVLLILIYAKTPDSNLPLILHYSAYQGVDFLGESYRIYSLPAVLLVFVLLNLALADFFYQKEKIISYFFILSLSALAVFFLIAGINLIIINN
jgi:hypothetical protein